MSKSIFEPNSSLPMTHLCVVDVTKSLNNLVCGIDGIARVELETAAGILGLGGKAVWIDTRKRIFEIDRNLFQKIISKAKKLRRKIRGARRWLPELGYEALLNLTQAQLLRRLRKTPFSPRGGECYLLFGAYWDRPSREIPAMFERMPGAQVVSFVHDLVPIRHPELTHNAKELAETFPRYLKSLVSVSKLILVNSNFTANELRAYCLGEGWETPDIRVIHLASDLDLVACPVASPQLISLGLKPKEFALMVSTFEPRKNHQFALELWLELKSRMPDATIPLIFAGKRGWLNKTILKNIQGEKNRAGSPIILVESPHDEELAWLYQNARFTIFPSSMEGYGLPVCESLSFGTYCLAADNSALKESSQGLAWHGSTEMKDLWIDEIQRCNTDPDYLRSRNLAVVQNFKKKRWSDFTKEVNEGIVRGLFWP